MLRHDPANEHIASAVGNLLAVGGSKEEGKITLQAQPPPALRALAAAVFHGEVNGPDGVAFPLAWMPEPPRGASGGTQDDAAAEGARRRPPRGPIPMRHRRRHGGG